MKVTIGLQCFYLTISFSNFGINRSSVCSWFCKSLPCPHYLWALWCVWTYLYWIWMLQVCGPVFQPSFVWRTPYYRSIFLQRKLIHYCPLRSYGKVMFSQASVILFTRGVCGTDPGQRLPWADTPLCRHPSGQTPPGQTPPGQTSPPRDGYCSGRTYWNAFLFQSNFSLHKGTTL